MPSMNRQDTWGWDEGRKLYWKVIAGFEAEGGRLCGCQTRVHSDPDKYTEEMTRDPGGPPVLTSARKTFWLTIVLK